MILAPAVWILIATGILGVALLVFERVTRRVDRNFTFFPLTIIALLFWLFPYAVELASTSRRIMMVAANIQFVGIGTLPFLLFCSIRQFLGKPVPSMPVTIGVLVIPVVTVVLAFVFPTAGIFRQGGHGR